MHQLSDSDLLDEVESYVDELRIEGAKLVFETDDLFVTLC